LHQRLDPGAALQYLRHLTGAAAKFEGQWELAADIVQAIGGHFAGPALQEIEITKILRGAVPAAAQQGAVKDLGYDQ
jgi:hypothetical protein